MTALYDVVSAGGDVIGRNLAAEDAAEAILTYDSGRYELRPAVGWDGEPVPGWDLWAADWSASPMRTVESSYNADQGRAWADMAQALVCRSGSTWRAYAVAAGTAEGADDGT